ncbi:cobaltochelatase subunit CobN [Tropicibacter naphthalenivorans]|uniref:Aerobic cobaltochelatase subunit CobN n=1 Tax=Tropicibacter naphthalenivorans TaxID=441103 RepID=A0A0P1GWU6_9RHOB|nr:cobaltochelatase subunit CobN [Tropicibacter naphthalenivorans]CUH80831.1 Aerobic cobaltochelatase subunit CobN [Tropicibacter naphthalenivorans]SMC90464.1 cobaltochelatase CobN subunit [Tropicibacter naphthalenivorans]
MHVIFRESHGLEETETPTDLGQTPADLVVLSLSDSDLGAFAEGWQRGDGRDGRMPSLRLANIAALKHPLSVDTYVEQTLSGAKGILIRLIGGVPYWPYGLQQIHALAQAKGIALAVLPADGRVDTRLDELSTLPVSTLRRLAHLCDTGGVIAAQAALAQMALAAGLYAGPVIGAKGLPPVGAWTPETGAACPVLALGQEAALAAKPRVLVVFYRSYLVAADLAPITALFEEFRGRGCDVIALFAPTLKAPDVAGWLRRQVRALRPAAILNATAFSGKGDSGTSPLDAGEVPVFQVALATSTREAWAEAERGLSPADLAMHVVLPEVDGRVLAGVASFKEPAPRDPDLQFSRYAHRPDPERISAIADRVLGWMGLAAKPAADRRLAVILSTYPGKDWNMGHAVGLDALASTEAILSDLQGAGYAVDTDATPLPDALKARALRWPLSAYRDALSKLPQQMQDDLHTAWGDPEGDTQDGHFHFAATQRGHVTIALQPERGTVETRDDSYHDLARTPRHAYVAFYLWLQIQTDALVHIGAHGTLEWLPGKAVALSDTCWPERLTGALPVVYPFIVNDPGEAAQAKRRIGAVTLGHIPPPLRASETPDRLARLEALLDEFSNADGLDPKRRDRLQADIRAEAQALGVEQDLGLDQASCTAEAITRIDRFVCDIKESQFGEGLHIWGRTPRDGAPFATEAAVASERQALLDALDGKRIEAGPSGSPYRGRSDVLPTGRNLFTTDPRSVPTRSAYAQGLTLAQELVRRHLQDEGDWPKGVIVDLWGSATMRTAGEEFAMALALLGVKPIWDKGSERVSGIEVLPIAELDRPRIDVTLRVSGLFRDVFPTLSALFGQAVRALAARDEASDWNPYVGRSDLARVYGPAPGQFGMGMGASVEDYTDEGRRAAGEAWLRASAWAYDGDKAQQNTQGIAARVAGADSFIHLQDLPETDLLLAGDYAAHEAGFAAAQGVTGGQANLYHLDNTDPSRPRARSLTEEIARVVQARAANPAWIDGMKDHGFRGAAEIAATLDHMASFAHLARAVPAHLFDLYHEATLGDEATDAFLREANPEAHAAMQARFAALLEAGLWQTRRNSVLAQMGAAE